MASIADKLTHLWVSPSAQRIRAAVETGKQRLEGWMHALGEMPLWCERCRKEFTLARAFSGEMTLLQDIPRYRGTLHHFCHDCAAILRAEYVAANPYMCSQCKQRHNRADSHLCAKCLTSYLAVIYTREVKRVEDQNQRARENGVDATLTLLEWLETVKDFDGQCYCCGKPFQALDHYIPLSKGGGTTAQNCLPICNRCNSIKGAYLPDELLAPSPRSPDVHQRVLDYHQKRWAIVMNETP